MTGRICDILANLRMRMGTRSFWRVAILCLGLGSIVGYQFNEFFVTRYREPKWESERQALETRIVKMDLQVNNLLNEKEQIAKELDALKCAQTEGKKVHNQVSLVISNQVLVAVVKDLQRMTNVVNEQVASLKMALTKLREKYSMIPANCTNSSLISVAYDLDAKMKLREEAIARQTDELKAIIVDILAGLQKEGQIQAARIKLLPLGARQKEDTDLASQFTTTVSLIGVFYGHFIKHIYQTADHIYYVNLLTPRDEVSLKYKAPFQCVEVARSLSRKINAPDTQDQNTFKRALEIMENHLNGCK